MRRRQLLQLAGAGALASGAGALTGCGNQGSGGSADAEDLGTLTFMVPFYSTQAPAEDGAMQKALNDFLGKTAKITWVPDASYGDRVNVTLASDDIPEVMAVSKTPNFVRSAEAGAFWDLTDRLGDYPELQSANPDVQHNASVNGKIFGIYKARDPMRVATMVRTDWLDQLGLELPKTVQDLYEIATAFKTERPNGKKDCYGLVIPKWPGGYGTSSPYDVNEVWHGAPNKWGERDGTLVPGFDTEEFFEANAFMKKMADEGLINADFATFDSAKWNEPFFNGDGGIIVDVSSRGLDLLSLFAEEHPDDYGRYIDMTGNLIGPDGELYAYPTDGYNGFLAISRQTVPTEEELADVLSVLAKLNTKEGQVLINNGIEGKNFKVGDGYAVAINEDQEEAAIIAEDVGSFAQLGMAVSGYKAYEGKPAGKADAAMDAKRDKFHAHDLEYAVQNPTLPYVSETYASKGAQLDLIIADARLKYIAGEIDLAELKSEIQRWHSSGGDDVAKELNELYQAG